MNGYISVKNWEQFQQYKDRDPKWIKLWRDLLVDYEFDSLTEIQQIHLVKIWLLAAKLGNKIPNDSVWIARQIGAKSKVDLKQLLNSGYLALYDCVQECTNVYLEEEKEEEQEQEEDNAHEALAGVVTSENWKAWVAYRKEIKKPLKPSTEAQQIKSLLAWQMSGHDCNEIILASIRNGWTGLFEPKTNKKKTNGASTVAHIPDEQLWEWAKRNGAPDPKNTIDYNYTRYRQDLMEWESRR